MGVMDRLACKLRRHSWEQHSDPAGTITFCRRCGAVRHIPAADYDPESSFPGRLPPVAPGPPAGGGGNGGSGG